VAAEKAPRPWAVYNVASGLETSVSELFRQLSVRSAFTRSPHYQEAKVGEVLRNALDLTRIRNELGWRPKKLLGARPGALPANVEDVCPGG
jgi:UDP-glucose 4-epimerase